MVSGEAMKGSLPNDESHNLMGPNLKGTENIPQESMG